MQLTSREGSPAITTPGELSKALFATIPPAPIPSAPPPPAYRSNPSDYAIDPDDDPYWPGRKRNRDADVGGQAGGWRDYDHGPSTGWQGDDRDWPPLTMGVIPMSPMLAGPEAVPPSTAMGTTRRLDPYAAGPGLLPMARLDYARPAERPPGHRAAPGGRGARHGRRAQRSLPLIGATKIPVGILAAAGALVLVAVVATVTFWPSGGPKPQAGNHATSQADNAGHLVDHHPAAGEGDRIRSAQPVR